MIRHELNDEEFLTSNKWAWFLGLAWADASLHKQHDSLIMELKGSDFDEMWEAFYALGFRSFSSRIRYNKFLMKSISSRKLGKFFKNYNFKNKSSEPPLELWNIFDEEQKRMFLRGLFEGDGSFAKYNKNKLRITMNSSKDYNWDWLLEYFKLHNIPKPCIERKSRIQNNKIRNYCIITWCKTEAVYKIYKLLYDFDLQFSLLRKQNILINYYNKVSV